MTFQTLKHNNNNTKMNLPCAYVLWCSQYHLMYVLKWRHVLLLKPHGRACTIVMIYGVSLSPLPFPSIYTAIITLNSIFLVLNAWIDVHNLFRFRQILNWKHQTSITLVYHPSAVTLVSCKYRLVSHLYTALSSYEAQKEKHFKTFLEIVLITLSPW